MKHKCRVSYSQLHKDGIHGDFLKFMLFHRDARGDLTVEISIKIDKGLTGLTVL